MTAGTFFNNEWVKPEHKGALKEKDQIMLKDNGMQPASQMLRLTLTTLFVLTLGFAAVTSVGARTPAARIFPTPQAAVEAVVAAARAKDRNAMREIFGPDVQNLLSGDEVADNNSFEEFVTHVAEATSLEKQSEVKVTLLVGSDEWPFPIPLIKNGDGWSFDTKAGTEEILNRRIGRNEIAVQLISQAYAVAQYEYFNGEDQDADQVSEYAQKLISSAGQKDGLYWETVADDEPSPLGPLFALARKEGYTRKAQGAAQSAAPFHGYYFKILTRQGASAPGGAYNYIINGNMIAGFALVAYPATWGNSGVMTFVINQEGRVYEKNLGARTAQIAGAMTEY
ncbi:MAG: DUF2950 domain-containing protein, partial [Pyrinomonadaceae bacterium]